MSNDNMIRTQISLEKEEYQLAKKEAKARGISVAHFVRMAVRDKLPAKDAAPGMRYHGDGESGDPNSTPTTDEIVYGAKDLSLCGYFGADRVSRPLRYFPSTLPAPLL